MGYAQANLVILPQKYAFDFLLFCHRNPKPCPLLEVLESGQYRTKFLASDADIRTDIPRYNIYRKGNLEATVKEIKNLWKSDFVTFLLGCSFSFEEALLDQRFLSVISKRIRMSRCTLRISPANLLESFRVLWLYR